MKADEVFNPPPILVRADRLKTPFLSLQNEKLQDLSFEEDGWRYDYKLFPRKGKPLVVYLPALQSNKEQVRPYFARWKWYTVLDFSMMAVSDPTLALSPKILGGWFQGTKDTDQLAVIARHVAAFARYLGLENQQIVFAGSSMGGFAAMLLACQLRGSAAYVEIPQVDFREYGPLEPRELVARHCYGVDDLTSVPSNYRKRLSVLEAFREVRYIPPIYYLQRPSDVHHWNKHFLPFQKFLFEAHKDASMTISEVVLDIYDDEEKSGHVALQKDDAIARIRATFDLKRT